MWAPSAAAEGALCLLWLGMASCSLFVHVLPHSAVGCIAQHGKTHKHSAKRPDTGAGVGAGADADGVCDSRGRQQGQSVGAVGAVGAVAGVVTWWRGLMVPKSFFAHFYLLGGIVTLLCLWVTRLGLGLGLGVGVGLGVHLGPSVITLRLRLCLLLLHLLRRLCECLWTVRFGQSQMHLGGYLAGLVHYLLVPMTFLAAAATEAEAAAASEAGVRVGAGAGAGVGVSSGGYEDPYTHPYTYLQQWWCVGCVLLFLLANLAQHCVHRQLAQMKDMKEMQEIQAEGVEGADKKGRGRGRGEGSGGDGGRGGNGGNVVSGGNVGSVGGGGDRGRYSLPGGMWFSLVCCPHYSAEVCIYACLCLLSAPISPSYASAPFSSFSPFSPISVSASAPLCLLLWVCANLAVVGQRQLCWYKGAFPQAFAQGGAKQHWAAICPGLC